MFREKTCFQEGNFSIGGDGSLWILHGEKKTFFWDLLDGLPYFGFKVGEFLSSREKKELTAQDRKDLQAIIDRWGAEHRRVADFEDLEFSIRKRLYPYTFGILDIGGLYAIDDIDADNSGISVCEGDKKYFGGRDEALAYLRAIREIATLEWKHRQEFLQSTDAEPPKVVGRREGGGYFMRVECPYCGQEHRHKIAGGAGHRSAHCLPDVPGHLLGYVVTEVVK